MERRTRDAAYSHFPVIKTLLNLLSSTFALNLLQVDRKLELSLTCQQMWSWQNATVTCKPNVFAQGHEYLKGVETVCSTSSTNHQRWRESLGAGELCPTL